MATAKPDMSVIWASAGTSVKPSDAKLQEGWTAEKPPYQSENWVQQRQDQYLKHLDERGVPEWGNTSEYVIGALVWYQDKIWESLATPNVGNAPSDGLGFWLSEDYLDRRGDTMSGPLRVDKGLDIDFNSESGSPTGRGHLRFVVGNTINGYLELIKLSSSQGNDMVLSVMTNTGGAGFQLRLNFDGSLKWRNQKVWFEGNDGPGSGLNADLLDGMQLQSILDLITGSNQPFSEVLTAGVYTVPANVTSCTFTLAGGGGGGGGGGDGGNSSGSAGGLGGNTIMSANSGVDLMTARGGNGGDGGYGNGTSGNGGGGGRSDWLKGTTIIGETSDLSQSGTTGFGDNPATAGNGGAGMFGLRGVGSTGSNNNSNGAVGFNGGGGSGGMIVQTIDLVAGDQFTITIGGKGLGGSGVSANRRGNDGGAGFAQVTYNV